MTAHDAIISAGTRLFRSCVRLYPRRLRVEYGAADGSALPAPDAPRQPRRFSLFAGALLTACLDVLAGAVAVACAQAGIGRPPVREFRRRRARRARPALARRAAARFPIQPPHAAQASRPDDGGGVRDGGGHCRRHHGVRDDFRHARLGAALSRRRSPRPVAVHSVGDRQRRGAVDARIRRAPVGN